MKKRKLAVIIIAVVLVVALLIPIPTYYNGSGTVDYKAVLYTVSKVSQASTYQPPEQREESSYTVRKGIIIEILGFEVYKDIQTVEYENGQPIESTDTISTDKYIVAEIIDMTENSDITTDSALQPFFEDEQYTYSYSSIKSDYVIVKFENGVEMTVAEALKAEYISISDLDTWDIHYIKESK